MEGYGGVEVKEYTLDEFREAGYAKRVRLEQGKRRSSRLFFPLGYVGKIVSVGYSEGHKSYPVLYFLKDVDWGVDTFYFEPATRQEYEKYQLMEELQ